MFLYDRIDMFNDSQKAFEVFQHEGVWSITQRVHRIFVNLHEKRVNACGHSRAGQGGNVFSFAP
jgi:hypothetical protein